ncbi:MAG TPA: hypothetical protein VFS75_03490 [Candidatus Paceibacterota bacterium]|nr:hypothetical protein [Candidatus Paceibacterota bacterium]
MKRTIIIALGLLFALPAFAAGPIIRTGENISIDAAQVLSGDFYGFAPSVTVSGDAKDDAYVAGGTVTVNAPIGSDLAALGGTVQVHGDVGDDLRVVAGDVTLGKSVKGDVVVLGGKLTVLSTASVGGDVIFMGGDLTVEGPVAGSVHGSAETARINAKVGGDVSLETKSNLTLGDNADIAGDVSYESESELTRAQNAHVGGSVHRSDVQPKDVPASVARTYLAGVFMLVFATMSLYFVGRAKVARVVEVASTSLGQSGLIGIASLILVPFVSSILIVSVIGGVLGVALFVAYLTALIGSLLTAGVLVGHYVGVHVLKRPPFSLPAAFLGSVLFALLPLVPYVGGLAAFALAMVTFGAFMTLVYRAIRG